MNDQPTEQPKAEAAQKDIMTPEELLPPKCRHCGSDRGYYFSRVLPMGNFCESCGGAWTEHDGVDPEENTRPSKAEEESGDVDDVVKGICYDLAHECNLTNTAIVRSHIVPLLSERDTLRASLAQAEQEISILKACLRVGEAPCGHSDQYSHSEDGGKVVRCYVCELAQAEQRVRELQSELSKEREFGLEMTQAIERTDSRVRELENVLKKIATGSTNNGSSRDYSRGFDFANRHLSGLARDALSKRAATSAQAEKEI